MGGGTSNVGSSDPRGGTDGNAAHKVLLVLRPQEIYDLVQQERLAGTWQRNHSSDTDRVLVDWNTQHDIYAPAACSDLPCNLKMVFFSYSLITKLWYRLFHQRMKILQAQLKAIQECNV